MIKFKEIETKYYADNIKLTDFAEFCEKRKPVKFLIASGYDHFYRSKKSAEMFFRHRVGEDFNQLTLKKKTEVKNNYIRNEHNIMLSKKTSREQIAAICDEIGYEPTSSIFKNAFIYIYERYTLVYYVVYDEEMKELGRFVEIEMSEEEEFLSEESAWGELTQIEKELDILGITAQNRIKRSLFEMFVK